VCSVVQEGEYPHDCKDSWYDEGGQTTSRGKGANHVYCTNSLGPLLYILENRVELVSAVLVPS
jgi:hypothetical protein